MCDNSKYNVNSFIGHSVVLQYVTFYRVKQIWTSKTRLNANLMQWRDKYANEYVTSPAATSVKKILWKTLEEDVTFAFAHSTVVSETHSSIN